MAKLLSILSRLRHSKALGYTVALAAFLLALGTRFALQGYLPPGYPYLTFFPAVIITTFVAGLRPGILAAVLCGLASWYFFISPFNSFALDEGTGLALGFYVFVVGIDIALIYFMNRALENLAAERNHSADLSRQMQVMFSELQHRVSNNLQMVSSLLLLQEVKIRDPAARRALEDARNRLSSLGRLHRKLHDPTHASLEMGSFLRELCDDLLHTSGTKGVVCEVHAVDAQIPQANLIPLALIVTELISNALEHAFPHGQRGTITIALRHAEDNRGLILTVEDNGAGLPPGFDLETTNSLGLQLARSLASQINARFTMASGSGTRCVLELPG